MRWFVIAIFAACTPSSPTTTTTTPPPPQDTRTPIEKRRDVACDKIGPINTRCAVEEAKRDFAAGKTTKADFDKDTSPDIVRTNTDKYVQKCKRDQLSSRQVRVYEVCLREETECVPFFSCLDNAKPQGAAP